jgi:hypothetical protein
MDFEEQKPPTGTDYAKELNFTGKKREPTRAGCWRVGPVTNYLGQQLTIFTGAFSILCQLPLESMYW